MAEANVPSDGRPTRRLLGLALLGGAILWAGWLLWQVGQTGGGDAQPTRAATAVPVGALPSPDAPTTGAVPTIAPATPWEAAGLGMPEEGDVVTPAAETLVEAPIVVYGPPAESAFQLGEAVTFYWTWPEPLAEDEQFSLYLRSAAGEQRIGSIDKANLGRAYSLRASIEDLVEGAGAVAWQVRLETKSNGRVLARSVERALTLR